MPQTHLTDTRFDSFDLDQRILDGLADAGFIYCTPIQAETLPIALAGRDIAGQAQTGTGKTAAFLVAAMQRLLTHPAKDRGDMPRQPRVVILAPTRELAVQIHNDAELIGRHAGLRLGLVYGGTGYQQQRDRVAAGVDILIGTPGRLIDYFKQHVFDFKSVEAVVLDEADRMFDLGFIKDIRFVLRRMPPLTERLGMLFSATLSYRVMELAYEHMNDPRMVEITPEKVTADRVHQTCFMVANDEKVRLLIGLIRGFGDARIMIFINTKREGEWVWGFLEGNGLKSAILSGDVPQKKRLSLLRQFQSGELPILVATDVAARGLHIAGVTHVINYDLPEDAEDYVHRIGRTARAGEAGEAISFVCETYAFCLPDIEAYIGSKIEVSGVEESLLADIDYRSRVRVPRRASEDRDGPRSGRRGAPGARDQRRRGGQARQVEVDQSGTDNPSHGESTAPRADDTPPRPPDATTERSSRPRRRRRKPATGSAPAS